MPRTYDQVVIRSIDDKRWQPASVICHGFHGQGQGKEPIDFFRAWILPTSKYDGWSTDELLAEDHGTRWLHLAELPAKAVPQKIGLRPELEDGRAFAIVHCKRCFAPVVWASDDLLPESESPVTQRSFNLDAQAPAPGRAVLWYEVDERGTPTGRQMFRRWLPDEGYTGETWSFHSDTCNGGAHAYRR